MPLSHIPLVWMVREAQRAGLNFDSVKLEALHCVPLDHEEEPHINSGKIPQIITSPPSRKGTNSTLVGGGPEGEEMNDLVADEEQPKLNGAQATSVGAKKDDASENDGVSVEELPAFHRKLHLSATKGKIHDVLCFKNGASAIGVIAWVSVSDEASGFSGVKLTCVPRT
jgi:hypothetical protein